MDSAELDKLITRTLREDAADRDLTTRTLVPANHTSNAVIMTREDAVVCGLMIAKKIFQRLDRNIRFQTRFKDGAGVKHGTRIASIHGNTRALLSGERSALNFLGYLSGIATETRRYVQKAQGTNARVMDTRKTTPGLRALEKYAVRCGGGSNHRADLSAMALIKDNHREACRPRLDISVAVSQLRKKTKRTIIVEVDNLSQFRQALTARPDIILLDNMPVAMMQRAASAVKSLPAKHRPLLEASGGITLSKTNAVARSGVDRISVGALTHTRRAINLTMELIQK